MWTFKLEEWLDDEGSSIQAIKDVQPGNLYRCLDLKFANVPVWY